eukprot:4693527-Ditylum_brightwellii.AAC.2
MLPLIRDNLARFCKEKDILLPFLQEKDNDGDSVMTDLTTSKGMTIDVGESGDQRVYKKESEEGNTNTKDKEEGEATKENISSQMGEAGTRNNNNDEAPVSPNSTGADMTESHPGTNKSLNTSSESDDASHITTLTGLAMEGEVNLEGTVDKNTLN